MKLALRYIPTEVWVDVFRYPCKNRKELGQLVDQIGNRKFAEFLQFYLHDWGKRTLEDLYLGQTSSADIPPIPQTPMPNNIKFFKRVTIWHFDTEALAFLRRINPLFISNDVNLEFGSIACESWPREDLTNCRTVLDHLAPLVNGIHSILAKPITIPLVEEYFAAQLPQLKMLTIDFGLILTDQAAIQTGINFCMNWLISGQREFTLLKVFSYGGVEIGRQFSQAVQQQFLTAKSAYTFAIQLYAFLNYHIPDFHLENSIGEQLHGQFNGRSFQILRHQPNGDKALQEYVETVGNIDKTNVNVIEFWDLLRIGPIAANANGVNTLGEEEEDGPSTSKKP